ncbi:MAG: MOSC N-terminal beta barrel domain-containing protein, partial [Chloroflexi bacterium]|nr:MOSC N-terminal beta barrel domain-containing protein [Chloroflexota bacterium]
MNFAGPLDAAPILPGTAVAVITQIALYPVKSMRGVAAPEAHLCLNGFYGDRRYAFVRKGLAASDGFPWMTGRQNPQMLLYAP